MKVPYREGQRPTRFPESCTVTGNGGGEALTGVWAGRPLSRENTMIGVPRLLSDAEGHIVRCALASGGRTPRGRRPRACTQASWAGTGRALNWPRGDGPWVRAYLGDRGR